MSLPVSDIVDVDVQVSPLPPASPSMSGILILGDSTKLTLANRVQQVTLDTLATYFAVSDPEYKAAAKAFAQSPAPDVLFIGRRFAAAQAGILIGATSLVGASLQAITAGAFDVVIDETTYNITALNFAGAAGDTLAHAATTLQTKLNAALAGTTCVVNAAGTGFTITSPSTGILSAVGYATPVTADTTTAAALGLTAGVGARRVIGIATEATVDVSLEACKRNSAAWFSFALTEDASLSDQTTASDWAETNKRPFYTATSSPAAYATPTSGDTDIAGYAMRKGYDYTVVIYTTDDLNAAVSADARMSTVDYTQPNSVISLWGKKLPGIGAEDIDASIKSGLDAKNVNYYATFGTFTMAAPGKVASGRFLDEVLGLDCWLAQQLMNEVFGAMVAFPQGIAQTDEDVYKLVIAAEGALRRGRVNGLLAPGIWPTTAAGVGKVKPGDRLFEGYYVYAAPVASQSAADRAARLAPPMTAIATGAGKVQAVRFNLVFAR